MNPISAFFVRHIIAVFFFYGLAFFVMGLALALASRRASEFRFAQAIRPLAAFGILHGLHEWVEMYQKIAALTSGYSPGVAEEVGRLALLALSLLMLLAFGILLLTPNGASTRQVVLPVAGIGLLWLAGVGITAIALRPTPHDALAMADVLARYSLGIPGSLLGTWALMTQQRTFREHDLPQFGRDLVWCATALLLYGVIGQAFVRPTALAPSNIINSALFLQWFGIPIQLFRAATAAALAFFMVRALNAFEVESRRALDRANQARLHAQTAAQEAERQRIARELHDATGQSLTAIALGLRGVEGMLERDPSVAAAQVKAVTAFTTDALGELRRIIADLRPSQLDDLGLVAALQWYAQECERRYRLKVTFTTQGKPCRLPSEYEIVLFRIVQEALTNVAKHAQATQAAVALDFAPARIQVMVSDDGQGFDASPPRGDSARPHWGLLGMRERAAMLGGQCEIASAPGKGTRVTVTVPLPMETTDVQ